MSINQYKNRKTDISIFSLDNGNANIEINNKICTGISKAVQKFNILLFNEIGTKLIDRAEGNILLSQLLYSNSGSEEAMHYFNIAIENTLRVLSEIDSDWEYEDEKIVSATIDKIIPDKTKVEIYMSLKTASENNIEYILPI